MSVVRVGYRRKCDGCGTECRTLAETPRRALAAAKRLGWQRRKVVVGQYEGDVYAEDSTGHWRRTGERRMYDDHAWRDFCPTCLDEMEATNG